MTLFQAILEKIKAYDTIIIHRHQRPDPDAIGSQIGLKEILKTNFSDKKILATGVNEPTLSWIAEMDEVPDNDYEGALVIVTDTANTPRIDDDRYDKGDFLIKIDHHPNDDAYGDLLLVDEASMIPESSDKGFGNRSLLDDLIDYVNYGRNCKLILIVQKTKIKYRKNKKKIPKKPNSSPKTEKIKSVSISGIKFK